jgi:hypothetical protein
VAAKATSSRRILDDVRLRLRDEAAKEKESSRLVSISSRRRGRVAARKESENRKGSASGGRRGTANANKKANACRRRDGEADCGIETETGCRTTSTSNETASASRGA